MAEKTSDSLIVYHDVTNKKFQEEIYPRVE